VPKAAAKAADGQASKAAEAPAAPAEPPTARPVETEPVKEPVTSEAGDSGQETVVTQGTTARTLGGGAQLEQQSEPVGAWRWCEGVLYADAYSCDAYSCMLTRTKGPNRV
jgi:hypothetical protein